MFGLLADTEHEKCNISSKTSNKLNKILVDILRLVFF